MPRRTGWAAAAVPLATLGALLSCNDLPTRPGTGGGRLIQNLVGCRVEVATGNTQCEPLSPQGRPLGKVSRNLIPDAQWMVETEPGAYTPADSTYRLNLRVFNGTETTLGTADGVQVEGIKVFLPVPPMGYTGRQAGDTSDPYGILVPPIQNTNSTVRARNPDGVASFTASAQPYWNYQEMVEPWASSGWRQWQFTVDPSVSYFYFAVSIITHALGEQPVTSSAPESWLIPKDSVDKLFAQQNLILVHPRMSGPYPRNVVAISFDSAATGDEKQAAVDRIGGTLVGGDGVHYYVLVAGGTEPVWPAIDQLRAMPQVEAALPLLFAVDMAYRRPNNGPGWQRGDWQVHPDSAHDANWGPEAIAAPSAWGCETGSSAVKVAVVDAGAQHATAVSAVIGNPGDTGSGITGIMWNSTRVVSDASRGGTVTTGQDVNANLHADFDSAISVEKVSVINISLAIPYVDGTGKNRAPVVGDTADINYAAAYADLWRRRLVHAETV
ncbi:MAG TPA: hypothetical protein VF771_05465, partial [Longimicrobiaceae bacterium]